ncbi:MAG: MFS transporter [Candidatus Heimdallarchaeota archaeon]|nr:MAG: MFS transporter [Candidatus Heimdallarchaeota archaeon]
MIDVDNQGGIKSRFVFLKYPNFGKLLLGQLVSNIGSQFSYIAILFLVYDLTGEIYAMAILSVAQAIPMILIGPWAGVVVDKIDRKYAMVFADIGQALAIILIPLTASFPDNVRIWWIIGIAFCNATFARFFYPARGASIPKLVEDNKDLLAANSLSAVAYQTSALVGPLSAGIIIGLFGYEVPFLIDSLSFFFSAICILLINRSLKAVNLSKQKPLQDLITGGRYVIGFLPLLYLLIVFSVLMFAGGASMILIVPYLETEFGLVEQGTREFIFGLMTSFSAALGILIAFLLSRRTHISRPVTLISVTTVLAGVILVIFGAAPNLWVVGLAWIGFGAIEVFIGIPLQTIAQETVPDALRGKIFSFINLSITVSQVIGMGIISVIANTSVGIRGSLMLSGILLSVFFVFGIVFLIRKQLESLVEIRRNELALRQPE